jgi:hypothetical protein
VRHVHRTRAVGLVFGRVAQVDELVQQPGHALVAHTCEGPERFTDEPRARPVNPRGSGFFDGIDGVRFPYLN